MDAEIGKVIGLIFAVVIVAGIIIVIMQVISSAVDVADDVGEMTSGQKTLESLCNEWLSKGAFMSTYSRELSDALHVLDGSREICPPRNDVTDTGELFSCRVLCILLLQAERNCDLNPNYYEHVDGFDEIDLDEITPSVQKSRCQSQIINIIVKLEEHELEKLHDCETENLQDDICENWRGRSG